MNRKYADARNAYNTAKAELGDARARTAALESKLKALLVECVNLRMYITEVARIVPVI